MKKNYSKFFAFTICLLLASAAPDVSGQTYVNGFISANTTWTMAASPYIVNGNTLVSSGYTLTIEPGVVVKFDTNRVLQIDGELIAIGTPEYHITFTSLQPSPHAGDWGKIHFADTCVDAVFDSAGHYLSGCIMKYCDVLYGGSLGFGEIHIEGSSPYFCHCNVLNSSNAGIYCIGATYLLDSSTISNNAGLGLYFNQFSLPCGLSIKNDTISNNSNGGIYLGHSNINCPIVINNNYFDSNATHGAIFSLDSTYTYSAYNVTIKKNNFLYNSSSGISNGILSFNYGGNYITISENYFLYNSVQTFGGIVQITAGTNITVANNNFLDNSCQRGSIIWWINQAHSDTIECNTFLNNHTNTDPCGVIEMGIYGNGGIIQNNIFDGNTNSSSNGVSVINIYSQDSLIEFINNTVRNNSSPNGSCCYFKAWLTDSTEQLHISNNNFSNNTSQNLIYFDGSQTNNSNYNFLYFKHNNINNSNSIYEIYNNIPYGSPDVYADSNYWGTTSTQHIDSAIYDFFDYGNLSVVYYQPPLSAPVEVDTSCSFLQTGIAVVEERVYSMAYPNPFSVYSQITFSNELTDAAFTLYNVFGQQVRAAQHISGSGIRIDRGGLPSGIYIYDVVEKERRVANGKLMVE